MEIERTRKRTHRAPRIAAVLMLLAVLYVVSLSPVHWLGIRMGVSVYAMVAWTRFIYAPVVWLREETPMRPALIWWDEFCADKLL